MGNVDIIDVKVLEKLTSIRLAEILSQKNVVPTDAITDALYAQDQYGEPFVQVLVSAEHISEWDLAKVVVEHFQLPFLQPSNYETSDEAATALPETVLFQNMLVPIDRFDRGLTIAMPVMTSFEVLSAIQRDHDVQLFPYVSLLSENKRCLGERFSGFKDWLVAEEARREKKARAVDEEAGGQSDWMNIFDNADQAVRSGLKDK